MSRQMEDDVAWCLDHVRSSAPSACELSDCFHLPTAVARLVNFAWQAVNPPVRSIPDEAICFFKDGNKWCCVHGDFANLRESPIGFGDTFDQALEDLQIVKSRPSNLE